MRFLRWSHQSGPSEIIIEPIKGWTFVNWRELWLYRDLLFLFIRREFITKYRQTALGPVWHVLQPLVLTFTFTLTFGKLVKISTDGIPAPLFYMAGLLVWGYFVQCFDTTAYSLSANAGIFNKVYFPRLIIPLAAVASKLMAFSVQFGSFLILYTYYLFFVDGPAHAGISWVILLLPIFLVITAAVSLGAGLWIAGLTVKYRDLGHVIPYCLQLILYSSPIIYPASKIPEQYQFLLCFHPLAVIVEGFRYAFFSQGTFSIYYLLGAALTSGILLVTGTLYFNRVERTFVDTI